MKHSSILIILTVTLFLTLLTGCSGSGTPVAPTNPIEPGNNLPVLAFSSNDDVFNAIGMLGAYELNLNNTNKEVELVAKRTITIGESFIVNGINFFAMTPCSDCLTIKSIQMNDNESITLTFSIRHPFEPGDPLKPPTGRNRLDLDIFDTALFFHPLNLSTKSYPLSNTNAYTNLVVNASGYTKELANIINEIAALPYVLILDDNKSGTNTYNKFAMGAIEEFDVLLDITDQITFDLYLTMGYGASATRIERLNPSYFNPEFNRKSAWKVVVTPAHGDNPPDTTNTWNEADDSTTFEISVEVFDWQIGANVDPDLTNQTDIFAASDVASVSLEIPGMHSTLSTLTTPASGSGNPDDPLVYTFSIANENLLSAGEYTGIVKVIDTRSPGSSMFGGETDTLADSIDGINLAWVNIPEFATYQTFPAIILAIDPLVLISPNGGEIWPIGSLQTISWTGGTIIDNVKLDYSKEDFVDGSDVFIIEESIENTGEYLWEIPDDESDTVKVRITAEDFPWINDTSEEFFTFSRGLIETIVYAADGPAPGRQIYTIDPEGIGPARQWTTSTAMFAEGPKLSPCGGYIAYTEADMSYANLRLIDVVTGIDRIINPTGLECVYCDFSNDGTRIVSPCASIWYMDKDLYIFDYNGENVERLTNGNAAWAPSYSPDDTKIVYQHFNNMQIWIYDFETGSNTQYTENTTWNDHPVFSKNGTQIAWATMFGLSTGRHIWISPVESWTPYDYRLSFEPYIRNPCFSPDGTRIMFDHGAFNGSELAIYNIDDGIWHDITSNTFGDYQAHWGFMVPIG